MSPHVSSTVGAARLSGAGDGDAQLARRVHVDRRVRPPGRHEQLQRREPLENGAREGRSLAHGDDDLEPREPLDERGGVGDVVGEDGRRDRAREIVPRPERQRDRLVVVEDRTGTLDVTWPAGRAARTGGCRRA